MAGLASQQEDKAADSVAAAFIDARDAAHLSKLERMGANGFHRFLDHMWYETRRHYRECYEVVINKPEYAEPP